MFEIRKNAKTLKIGSEKKIMLLLFKEDVKASYPTNYPTYYYGIAICEKH